MDLAIPPELEELILCSCCHSPFNDTDAVPKLFTCRHYFCLKCVNSILQNDNKLYCIHCWKRTELPGPELTATNLPTYHAILFLTQNLAGLSLKTNVNDKKNALTSSTPPNGKLNKICPGLNGHEYNSSNQNGNNLNKDENCMIHAMPKTLFCIQCNILLCRACAESEDHRTHTVHGLVAKETISNEVLSMQLIVNDVQHLVWRQRDFLLTVLDSCTTLKTQIETELINHNPTLEIADMRESLGKAQAFEEFLELQTPVDSIKLFASLNIEKQRLQSKFQESYLQCKLDDLIRNNDTLFDFDLIKNALYHLQKDLNKCDLETQSGQHNSILLLANYCISQLYSRYVVASNYQNGLYINHHQQQLHTHPEPTQPINPSNKVSTKSHADTASSSHSLVDNLVVSPVATVALVNAARTNPPPVYTQSKMPKQRQQQQRKQHHSNRPKKNTTLCSRNNISTILNNPSVHVFPIVYFDIEINCRLSGRILIEVRNDVAPRMANNFEALSTGEFGYGYKGCQVFQCWDGESIITGDFELNNGRGGRSVFKEATFMPEDTKMCPIRGTVGMRRSQRRHDNLGLVGSQFRIILCEMQKFTAIFAFVLEGLEFVEKISQSGDLSGKPLKSSIIVNCGKYE